MCLKLIKSISYNKRLEPLNSHNPDFCRGFLFIAISFLSPVFPNVYKGFDKKIGSSTKFKKVRLCPTSRTQIRTQRHFKPLFDIVEVRLRFVDGIPVKTNWYQKSNRSFTLHFRTALIFSKVLTVGLTFPSSILAKFDWSVRISFASLYCDIPLLLRMLEMVCPNFFRQLPESISINSDLHQNSGFAQ